MIVLIVLFFILLLIFIKFKCTENFININSNIFDNIYCVNLDKSVERMNYIKQITKKQNIKINRFSAINGNQLNSNQIEQYCSKRFISKMKS